MTPGRRRTPPLPEGPIDRATSQGPFAPPAPLTPSVASATILAGGGEMGALMRAHDWARTPVGPVESWPQSLRTAVSILLDSRYPMYIAWGPQLVQFYNDGYRPVLGSKHPDALGRGTQDTWPEIWDEIVGPMFRRVMTQGEATYLEDFLFPLHRHGYTEECYFTFCYSPIREESGAVGGVFVTCIETTARMVGERRLRTLRELAARGADATSAEDACRRAAAVLATDPLDLPFAAIYLVDDDGRSARLAGAAGVDAGHPAAPERVDLVTGSAGWPLAGAAAGHTVVVDDLVPRFGDAALPGGGWPETPWQGVVVPVPRAGEDRAAAFLVAGISARRALDDDYRGFLELVAGQTARAIASARAHEEERARAEALAELDRAKTAFFSNVSHEFRTPLTLLLGPTEEVLADPRGTLDPAYRERLEIAHRNARRLLRLVNTLLEFSRIEAGRIDAAYEPVDVARFTAELASGFRSALERAGLRLAIDCPPLDAPLHLDREMWEKIVLNLLSNAFKHTFAGAIAVAVRRVGDAVELAVRDTGVGIPAGQLPHVFERFHRVAGSRARTHEGSGIGLALVQELVRLHGGTVRVESREDHGSTFTVRVPLGTAHLPADHLRAAGAREAHGAAAPFVEEALRWLPDASRVEAARVDAAASPGEARATILLADDNADMRDYVTRLLSGRGWRVVAVADGRAALDHAIADPPDLVLTDVMMPGLDGFALLRALRARPATRTVPVILLSARAGEESRVEGLDAGADDYLVKPFTAQELLARTNTHLSLARLRRAAEAEQARLLEATEAARAELELKSTELEQAAVELEVQSEELRATSDRLHEVNHQLSISEARLREEAQIVEMVQHVGTALASELDLSALVQTVTDEAARLTGAQFGAFFYNVVQEAGESYTLYTISGVPREAFSKFPMPRNTHVFEPTFRGTGVLRSDDITQDPRYGRNAPYYGKPQGHLPVVSYLAVPVTSRTGEVVGGLFFGHEERAVFTERHERLAVGVAAWAALAIDNARLYERERRARADAEGARRDAEHANKAKTDFLATMSHELRTPLNAIAGYVELLDLEIRGPITAQQRDDLHRIHRSQQHLASLINDILNFAKLEAGQVEFRPTAVPVDELLRDMEQLVAPQLAAKALAYRCTAGADDDGAPLAVRADEEKVRQVLLNLLTNAVKFTDRGGEVTVRCTGTATTVAIEVRDTGRGIPPEKLPTIFEPFVQVDRHLTPTSQQGVGLGLAISRDLARAMGGDIAAESAVGRGSTFTLTLPRAGEPA